MLSILAIIKFNCYTSRSQKRRTMVCRTERRSAFALSRRLPDDIGHMCKSRVSLSLLGSIDKRWLQTNGRK
jgi:hypothetical protein